MDSRDEENYLHCSRIKFLWAPTSFGLGTILMSHKSSLLVLLQMYLIYATLPQREANEYNKNLHRAHHTKTNILGNRPDSRILNGTISKINTQRGITCSVWCNLFKKWTVRAANRTVLPRHTNCQSPDAKGIPRGIIYRDIKLVTAVGLVEQTRTYT